MIRNLKALVLAAMAITAVSAVTASTAFAVPAFNSESTSTLIKASADGIGKTGHQVLDVAGGTVTCNVVNLNGFQTEKTMSSITLTAEFINCTFLGQAASVKMGGCDFVFKANGTAVVHRDTGIVGGGACIHHSGGITITIAGCTVIVPEQTGLEWIQYHNTTDSFTGKKAITAEPSVTDITYDSTGAACPQQPAGTYNDGTLTTGNVIITGIDADTGAATGISYTP
jgi:hypothetical protein